MDTKDATLGHEAAAYAEQCRLRRNIGGVLEGHRKAAHHFARARDKSTSEAVKVAMDEYARMHIKLGERHSSLARQITDSVTDSFMLVSNDQEGREPSKFSQGDFANTNASTKSHSTINSNTLNMDQLQRHSDALDEIDTLRQENNELKRKLTETEDKAAINELKLRQLQVALAKMTEPAEIVNARSWNGTPESLEVRLDMESKIQILSIRRTLTDFYVTKEKDSALTTPTSSDNEISKAAMRSNYSNDTAGVDNIGHEAQIEPDRGKDINKSVRNSLDEQIDPAQGDKQESNEEEEEEVSIAKALEELSASVRSKDEAKNRKIAVDDIFAMQQQFLGDMYH